MKSYIIFDLLEEYENVRFRDEENLYQVMKDIFAKTKIPFIILIDEWDCIFREYKNDFKSQKKYLDFIRSWLKDQSYVALAYMTGILPIKKYGTHSALNMFSEYSMADPGNMTEYFGFTHEEVRELCNEYNMDLEEAESWYDGYKLVSYSNDGMKEISMYNPKSVVEAMLHHKFGTYWNRTETYEALKIYIQMNMDGLKEAVIDMLGGGSVTINTGTFSNDMTTFAVKDDVLTLLVHLGYLSYYEPDSTVSIPNKEVSLEYVNAISTMDWHGVAESVAASRKLKYDKSAEGAIAQIKEKNYTAALADYHGNLLLAGINYDKDTKTHTCVIEKMEK